MLFFLKFSKNGTFGAVLLLYNYKTPQKAKANALAPLFWKKNFWSCPPNNFAELRLWGGGSIAGFSDFRARSAQKATEAPF